MRLLIPALLLLLPLASAACSSATAPGELTPLDRSEQDVIGGRAESGYAAVGYLFDPSTPQYPAICGVTLIAPDVVVTAAHCVAGASYEVGFGAAAVTGDAGAPPAKRYIVRSINKHPAYRQFSNATWSDAESWNDVALLVLDRPVTDRKPATIGLPATTCTHRYVGYGRVTEGGPWVGDAGYTGARKSTQICVDGQDQSEILIHGVGGGGNCWGDSGGPLMVSGTSTIVAVMSRFAPRADRSYECHPGDAMVMTALAGQADFIRTLAPRAFAAPAPAGPALKCTTTPPVGALAVAYTKSETIVGHVAVAGITKGPGMGKGVRGELGIAPAGTPAGAGWLWYAATYAGDSGDEDTYSGSFTPFFSGAFDANFRFTTDDGATWTTCARR